MHAERQKKYCEKQLQKYEKEAIKEKRIEKEEREKKANTELVRQKDRVRKQRSRQNAARKLLFYCFQVTLLHINLHAHFVKL